MLILSCVVLVGLNIINGVFTYLKGRLTAVASENIALELRESLYAHLQKLPFRFYDNHETGRIMTRITSDLFEVCELAHHGPENLFICAASLRRLTQALPM